MDVNVIHHAGVYLALFIGNAHQIGQRVSASVWRDRLTFILATSQLECLVADQSFEAF